MSIEVGVGYLSILPSTDKLAPAIRREWEKISGDTERRGKRDGKGYGTGFRDGIQGMALAATGALAAVTGLGASAVKLEKEFSQTMNVTAATLGAPQAEMQKLTDLALKLGADTSFSASEAATAMQELAKGGLDAATISAGGLAGTLELAAAGGTSLESAATIAANALNTFNLEGKDMAAVSAALAGGANASTASVESLGEALSQVGPGAKNAGLDLNETVGALAAFDNAGIKGSDAGTSLKTMLASLVPDTAKAADAMADLGLKFTDAEGNFLPLTNIAQQLQDRLGGLSESQRTLALNTIFGSDASRAATVLMEEGAKGLQGYIDATKDQGAAQAAAEARMKGTAGALERLGGAWETFQLQLGRAVAPAVTAVSDKLGNLLGFLGENHTVMLSLLGVVAGLAALIVGLNVAFAVATTITRAWTTATAAATAVQAFFTSAKARGVAAWAAEMAIMGAHRVVTLASAAAQWALNAAMTANPIGLIIAGIAALVAGLVWFFTQTELGQKIWTKVWGAIQVAASAVVDWFQNSAMPVFRAIWDGIVKFAQGAWVVLRVIFVSIATAFQLWLKGMQIAWNLIGRPIWNAIVTAARWVWNNGLKPVFIALRDGWANLVQNFRDMYYKYMLPTWQAIRNAATTVWNWVDRNVIKPFILGLRVLGLAARIMWTRHIVPAWNGIRSAIGAAWNWIKRWVFIPLRDGLDNLGSKFVWLNRNAIRPAWQGIRTASSAAWSWVQNKVFTPFKKGIDLIGKAFQAVRKVIAAAWDRIKSAAARPVNFVIDTVYNKGIKATWDKIAKSVGLDLELPPASTVKFANGSEDHRAQIARPGAMRLWAEPETGGEAYIPLAKSKRGRSTAILSAVARKFGYGLNKYADGGIAGAVGDIGKKVLDFFTDPASVFKGALNGIKSMGGGIVGKIAGALPGKIIDAIVEKAKSFGGGQDVALTGGGRFAGGPVMGWQNMWNVVKNAFPGATLNSAYRPGAITAVGTPSFHGRGRAIDVTPSMAIFNWLVKTFPNSSELIYSPAGGRQLYMGRKTFFGEPTRGDHWDHVHWAMANGGMLFDNGGMMPHKGIGANMTGKPEAVLTPRETRAYQAVAAGMVNAQGRGTRQRVILQVGDREFTAFMREVADDAVDDNESYRGTTRRMR